jgi:hypothetical protein
MTDRARRRGLRVRLPDLRTSAYPPDRSYVPPAAGSAWSQSGSWNSPTTHLTIPVTNRVRSRLSSAFTTCVLLSAGAGAFALRSPFWDCFSQPPTSCLVRPRARRPRP